MSDEESVDPFKLVPGKTYRVEFQDCCVNGWFVGEFVELENPGYFDHSGDPETDFDFAVFTTGKVDGSSWTAKLQEEKK